MSSVETVKAMMVHTVETISNLCHFGLVVYIAGLPQSGKISGKRNFFQVREKSGNFMDGQGNLEKTWKVREFENKWIWQADFRKFIYTVQEGKDILFHEIV